MVTVAPDVAYTVFVVAEPLLIVATAPELIAYVKSPKLFELGSINENELSVMLYTPLFAPNVIVEIRELNDISLTTQLLDGVAPNIAATSVPCARVLVLSNAVE